MLRFLFARKVRLFTTYRRGVECIVEVTITDGLAVRSRSYFATVPFVGIECLPVPVPVVFYDLHHAVRANSSRRTGSVRLQSDRTSRPGPRTSETQVASESPVRMK